MRTMMILLAAAVLAAACGGDDKCKPECDGKQCGDDGCGGVCGTCGADAVCALGECVACKAECTGQQCGPDGCGGECGACSGTSVCDPMSFLCIEKPANCQPACEKNSFTCGPDGCGGDCGSCAEGTFCKQATNTCEGKCEPKCGGKQCGDDECGGQCGTCAGDETCDNGVCINANLLPDDDYKVLYGQQGRIPTVNDDQYDLFLINPDGTNPLQAGMPGPQAITTFSLEKASDCQLIIDHDAEGNPVYGPCSCNFGCIVDRSLKWIAISIQKPGDSGFTFQLGRFDATLAVSMVKGIFFKDVIQLSFAGNYLYYSKMAQCEGPNCQYDIFRAQLEPVGQPEQIFTFPPANDPDWPKHSNYKGHFKVSRDGQVLVLLGTTIRSQRIYMWKAGNLHELDYLCATVVNNECIGAGSEYTDTDPVAISPDHKVVLAFTIAETELRLRLYDTDTLQQKYLTLNAVPPPGGYLVNACPVVQATPWKFKRVWGDPVFSPDGTAILFNAYNDCGLIQASSKPHTNILMLDLSAVGDGTPFEETDFVNLTKNPKGDGAENLVIDSFDISLTGKTIAFSATPMYSKGQPADPDRANKDKEIWLIGVGGTGKTQLTDDAKYLAKGPMMLDPAIFQAFSNPQ